MTTDLDRSRLGDCLGDRQEAQFGEKAPKIKKSKIMKSKIQKFKNFKKNIQKHSKIQKFQKFKKSKISKIQIRAGCAASHPSWPERPGQVA